MQERWTYRISRGDHSEEFDDIFVKELSHDGGLLK